VRHCVYVKENKSNCGARLLVFFCRSAAKVVGARLLLLLLLFEGEVEQKLVALVGGGRGRGGVVVDCGCLLPPLASRAF
jgi:hypothetical protein